MISQFLYTDAIQQLLGIKKQLPLTWEEMARSLQICIFPHVSTNERLKRFDQRLSNVLIHAGAKFIQYPEALIEGVNERVRKGVVLIASGDVADDRLPINHVSSLSENVIVSVLEHACPAHAHTDLQAKLNAMMSDMAWHFAHVLIYLEPDDSVTVCNWNGAIIQCRDDRQLAEVLVPKLAAPVVPPRMSDFDARPNAFDPANEKHQAAIRDMVESGPLWAATGLMISQTLVSSLNFRNKYYRRLGAMHLDHRTGMSYGFLARQLPVPELEPAMTLAEARDRLPCQDNLEQPGRLHSAQDKTYLSLSTAGEVWVVPIPDVWVLSTRSGCEKTKLNAAQDIVRYGLNKGRIIFETPLGTSPISDCKPSYDTMVIVAHALANAIMASVLAALDSRALFYELLKDQGLALAHWHGFLNADQVQKDYPLHGESNPGVSCSTPQSAIYVVQGKLSLLDKACPETHQGDVHIEPHHGTNFTCASLTKLARTLSALKSKNSSPALTPLMNSIH